MDEKDAQVLIKYLIKKIDATEAKYEALKVGRDEWETWGLAHLRGLIDGMRYAIELIERAVGEEEE